ncbi:protein kinase domain-containing protein [Myxococcus qinghaiensis]|uniref:protein kinase domain-containing protein n=1 Tax=Myxococcus qinghaiensis TaxID=2906758 RepID=UPI0020A72186|nr:protein kinase [Myxococcus qinghaiensis]MCP3167541.1 protein kinase [Myxococcus qinghaiensis]
MSPTQTTHPGSEEVPPPLLRPYGPYVLVRKLAEGGMAEIFLAKLLGADGFERNVVIKRMLPHLSSIPDFVEMFRDEARLAAKLAHPNIVQIQELGFTEGCYYICMEYLAGEDFSTTLRLAGRRRQYLPFPIVLRVLIDSARGLHYAHEFANEMGQPQNVVHRDVSPSNLYLTYQGQVKVLDFGIAKAESRLANTRTGVVKGKYMYMAPEQAKGGEVDRRADIFALGVSLFEALTHVRPFSRENDLAVLNALLHNEFKRPRELRPDLPLELEAIVLKAMSPFPEDRHPTAEAFAEELEAFLGAHLSSAGTPQLGAFLRSHFGDERFTERTRIPTLASLSAALGVVTQATGLMETGTNVVGAPASVGGSTDVATARGWGARSPASSSGLVPAATKTPATENSVPPVEAPRSRGWRPLVVGLAGGLLLASVGLVGYRQLVAPASGGEVVAPAPVAPLANDVSQKVQKPDPVPTPPSEPVAAPTGVGSVAQGAEAAPEGDKPEAVGAQAALPSTVGQDDEEVAEKVLKAPPAKKRVTLGVGDITRVVEKGRTRITACFEKNRADLPSTEGQVQVEFSIASSGAVRAGVRGPLAETAVGRCLQSQAQRLRFPAHRDEEVNVLVPFAWRLTR